MKGRGAEVGEIHIGSQYQIHNLSDKSDRSQNRSHSEKTHRNDRRCASKKIKKTLIELNIERESDLSSERTFISF